MVLFLVGHLHPSVLGRPALLCAAPAADRVRALTNNDQREGQVAASLGECRKIEEFSQTTNSALQWLTL